MDEMICTEPPRRSAVKKDEEGEVRSIRAMAATILQHGKANADAAHLEQLQRAVDIVPNPDVLVEAASGHKRFANGRFHACDLPVLEGRYHVVEAKIAALAANA